MYRQSFLSFPLLFKAAETWMFRQNKKIEQVLPTTWNLHDEMAVGVFAASHFVVGAARGGAQNKRPACAPSAIFAAQTRAREELRHRSERSV